ncbi:uncharacterized protein DUF1375 [Sinobacterium caligoides]|uniref:Uncharacterized protein DUF1375 n=1 Tax=Sinobacterium caligoides TaxID=933926 RepID=A0A3N2DDL6_9GAMM|nr:YceK/YidQ family lipoprotein [Sinobacterium caligoides]ROR97873.1 uncharacterized protein DUF1375 [Sinobacterium caligoides]
MRNKHIFIMTISFVQLITGCATGYTLTGDPEEIHRTSCASGCATIPRIYSGTAVDLCGIFPGDGGQGSAIMFYDIFFSLPADTIALPYTIYGQFTKGSLSVSDECESNQTPNKALKRDKAKNALPLS